MHPSVYSSRNRHLKVSKFVPRKTALPVKCVRWTQITPQTIVNDVSTSRCSFKQKYAFKGFRFFSKTTALTLKEVKKTLMTSKNIISLRQKHAFKCFQFFFEKKLP